MWRLCLCSLIFLGCDEPPSIHATHTPTERIKPADASLWDASDVSPPFEVQPLIEDPPVIRLAENPKQELCDSHDNDKDGEIDEDFRVGEVCTEGVGACESRGLIVCDGVAFSRCSATPSEPDVEDSLCDGVDSDCDGDVDEDYIGGSCTGPGVGQCVREGVMVCQGVEQCSETEQNPPQEEACNTLDDDCDGSFDEGLPDVRQPCWVGRGACQRVGRTECTLEGDIVCNGVPGMPAPNDSTCDLIDDDCDGLLDEDPPCNGTACSPEGVPEGFVCIPPRQEGSPTLLMREIEVTQDEFMRVSQRLRIERNPSYNQNPANPVELVSQHDARRWLNELSYQEGFEKCYQVEFCLDDFYGRGCGTDPLGPERSCDGLPCETDPVPCDGYRLPTEAEWEHAAQVIPEGGGWVEQEETQGVAQLAPNRFGLFDMVGNVAEWVEEETLCRGSSAFEGRGVQPRLSVHSDYRDRGIGFRYVREF